MLAEACVLSGNTTLAGTMVVRRKMGQAEKNPVGKWSQSLQGLALITRNRADGQSAAGDHKDTGNCRSWQQGPEKQMMLGIQGQPHREPHPAQG